MSVIVHSRIVQCYSCILAVIPAVAAAVVLTVDAPLAQSAEHSHGKAGVVSSILTGGSPKLQVTRACTVS